LYGIEDGDGAAEGIIEDRDVVDGVRPEGVCSDGPAWRGVPVLVARGGAPDPIAAGSPDVPVLVGAGQSDGGQGGGKQKR
jgi:hypothetical protein